MMAMDCKIRRLGGLFVSFLVMQQKWFDVAMDCKTSARWLFMFFLDDVARWFAGSYGLQ